MKDPLATLLSAEIISPLSYHFARFMLANNSNGESDILTRSAALVSDRNQKGHVCVDLSELAGLPLFDNINDEDIEIPLGYDLDFWIRELKKIDWVGSPDEMRPLVLDGDKLYLGKYHHYETELARQLLSRINSLVPVDEDQVAILLAQLFPSKTEETDWQKVAAAIAIRQRFCVISGGPGTGKTTTVVKVLSLLLSQNSNMRIGLAAPTGKAAARLSESIRNGKTMSEIPDAIRDKIPEKALTVHRLLGSDGISFRRNQSNPILLDCLLLDEASMIDLPLMAKLFNALPSYTRVILLGDRDQLASVEAGSVLGDITGQGAKINYSETQLVYLKKTGAINSDFIDSFTENDKPAFSDAISLLKVSYRFSSDSGIGVLANSVNAGGGKESINLFSNKAYQDIHWLTAQKDKLSNNCINWAEFHYSNYLKQDNVRSAIVEFNKVRVLTAMHEGIFGDLAINQLIEDRLRRKGLIQQGQYYSGMPVMIISNDYELELFNGDIGLLWNDESHQLRAYFLSASDELKSITLRMLPEHVTAYAFTVHKSQGSEFDNVLFVLPHDINPVMTRELVYTGITRAKKHITIHASENSFEKAVTQRVHRSSGLANRLGWS